MLNLAERHEWMVSIPVPSMMTSLYFFGEKENGTWGKDVLFDSMNDPTDIVVAIEEFASINKDDAVSGLDGFVDKENEDWDLIFWSKCSSYGYFWKDSFWMRMKIIPLGVL